MNTEQCFWNAKCMGLLECKTWPWMQKVKLKNDGEKMVLGSVILFQFEVQKWNKEYKQWVLKCSLGCQSTI